MLTVTAHGNELQTRHRVNSAKYAAAAVDDSQVVSAEQ